MSNDFYMDACGTCGMVCTSEETCKMFQKLSKEERDNWYKQLEGSFDIKPEERAKTNG